MLHQYKILTGLGVWSWNLYEPTQYILYKLDVTKHPPMINKLKSFQDIEVTRALYLHVYRQNFLYQTDEIKLNVVLWLYVINTIPIQMQSAF